MKKRRKYLYSLGVAYYPEKEMLRLQKQAMLGWQFVGMNRWGFLTFEKQPPMAKKFAVDFFEGELSEESDYIALYEASGWHYISHYQKRYYYFEGNLDAPPIFSDQDSYQERINAEQRYLMKRAFLVTAIGALLLAVLYSIKTIWAWQDHTVWSFVFGMCTGLLCVPAVVAIMSYLMGKLYKDRATYYKEPEKIANRQKVVRDLLLMALAGAIVGGIIGYIF